MDHDQDPRWIRLRPSRIHLAVAVAGALGAGVVIALLPILAWVQLGMIAAIVLLALHEIHRARLRGAGAASAFYLFDVDAAAEFEPHSIVARRARPALAIRLRLAAEQGNRGKKGNRAQKPPADLGDVIEGVVLANAYVTPWFTSLPYRLTSDPPWRQRWPRIISLWPDSLDADAYRRVRVQLKWK